MFSSFSNAITFCTGLNIFFVIFEIKRKMFGIFIAFDNDFGAFKNYEVYSFAVTSKSSQLNSRSADGIFYFIILKNFVAFFISFHKFLDWLIVR